MLGGVTDEGGGVGVQKGRMPSQEAELVRQIKQLLREADALSA